MRKRRFKGHRGWMSLRMCGTACIALMAPLVTLAVMSAGPSPSGASTDFAQGAQPSATVPSPCSDLTTFAQNTDTSGQVTYQTIDYLVGNYGWDAMDGKEDHLSSLSGWAGCKEDGNSVTPIIAVPIIPTTAKIPNGTLENGAADAYKTQFQILADSLHTQGLTNAVLRLGWEFDDHGYPWTTDKQVTVKINGVNHLEWEPNQQMAQWYAEYFQHIVTDMLAEESVDCGGSCPGGNFKFAWNPDGYGFLEYTSNSSDPTNPVLYDSNYDIADAWPGSSYVDYIGLDLYDQEGWDASLNQSQNLTCNQEGSSSGGVNCYNAYIAPQLNDAEAFSAQNGNVPLAFPEWGVCWDDGAASPATETCQGDDPAYIAGMGNFMSNPASLNASDTIPVAWESYFNVDEAGWNSEITNTTNFPISLDCFEEYFAGQSEPNCTS